VRPAWIAGCELVPCPLLGVVLFPFEVVHVVAQQDEGVGAGTRAENMAVVVDVAGRGQRHDVAAVHGAVIGQVQFGPAVVVADGVPALVGLHAADGGDRDPAVVGVGVGHHSLGPVEQYQAGTPVGLDEPRPPGRLSGDLRDQRTEILFIRGQLHQEPPHLVHIEDVAGTQLLQPGQELAKRARENASAHLPPLTHGPLGNRPTRGPLG
jgi:hypothetical protein